MAKRIPLTQGKYALVDDEDYEWLSQWKWYAHRSGRRTIIWYAARAGETKVIMMHRQILKPPSRMLVDHINSNGIDNRRSNLRSCTPQQNAWNKRKAKTTESGYLGVVLDAKTQKWRARIGINKKLIHIGYFDSKLEAAIAYDKAALELHGEFASLNFPDSDE